MKIVLVLIQENSWLLQKAQEMEKKLELIQTIIYLEYVI